jgi:uncharacterized repeat protein (TIGR01451 family)
MPGPGEIWVRVAGHYVTVAGINSTDLQIAFSDPFFDNAEAGGPGRVLSGTLIPHIPIPGHPVTTHNDAGNVSHDVYTVTLTAISPGGLWEIDRYPYDPGDFESQNCPNEFLGMQGPYIPLPPPEDRVYAEVEYAIAMSPFTWKPGGEWVDTWWNEQWITEWWAYEDDGHSCLPDFKWSGADEYVYDGPTALANSLWWFDSKAETLVTGGWPITPELAISDHYDLITTYGAWDDHAITNTTHVISDLATFLGTGPQGTTSVSMTNGIGNYLTTRGVSDDFYTDTQDSPSWEWIADEVETCEDVLLLLGFYEDTGLAWERKGGHWVNAAGVSRDNWFVGLSDPALDYWHVDSFFDVTMGRVFPPEHIETPFTEAEKLAPQAISHDIYRVMTSTTFADRLTLVNYPFTSTSVLTNFVGRNGGGTDVVSWGNPLETVIEWAIGVSPHSDLEITKTAFVTEVVPGDLVTYTISYTNTGLAAAHNIAITDTLNLNHLTNVTFTAYPPINATANVTYAWTRSKLSYGQTGTITIAAQSLVTTTLYNEATITGTTWIGHPTPDRDPADNSGEAGTRLRYIFLPLVMRNYP